MYSMFKEIYEEFRKAGSEDPFEETVHLLDIVTGGVVRGCDLSILEEKGLTVAELVRVRSTGKPMEYILGEAPFLGWSLVAGAGALIPRQETELLAGICIQALTDMLDDRDELDVIELGTGSGNIAVAIALDVDEARVWASDVSEEAVAIARLNVERFDIGDRVRLFSGDLFEPLAGEGLENDADLVVCNPPYIPTSSLEKLASEIIDHEPVVALDAGAYGINIFRRLISESPGFLRQGGMLAFEIGAGQDKLVERLFKKAGDWVDVNTRDDGEAVRVFTARKA
ncbi:MAG: peptide chain release factor N(5)-glutamine methyltransferase [Candidatus Krumholzibacteria bacterium]|nr:peptide chain release factor N(5)-glutamine methyltransferase [Candidatus Krumholzibacteria bacterium]